MVRITKVYTKTGDQGVTKLAGGKSVCKTSRYASTLGSLDELNAFLGFAAAALHEEKQLHPLQEKITRIQNELFDLGAQIAVLPAERRSDTPAVKEKNITYLEQEIDVMNGNLPTLKSFILPQGGEAITRLHLARTVCRRTEREVLLLHQQEKYYALELKYLNRLSDWLFVAARTAARLLTTPEILWNPKN